MKKAEIQYQDRTAGWLIQGKEGYHFMYDVAYLESENPKAISVTSSFGKSLSGSHQFL